MVAIKRKMLQSVNSVIVFLISLLGFTTSCVPLEYGTPHADFIITGKIASVTNSLPIPDIIVEMHHVFEDEGSRLEDTAVSLPNGEYRVGLSDSPNDHTIQLRFVDTDGALNGEYESLDTVVVFQDPKFTGGDGDWYMGSVQKELNIQLKPKE